MRERRLPVSMFLTDSVMGPGYGHFARLRAVGANLQNHTLDHPALPGLPYAGQRAQICGQQRKLASRFGIRPRLFRPPYGTYDTTTLRAAADCGIAAVVLWRVTLEPDGHLTYAHGPHRLLPGDIVSVPSGEAPPLSLAERTTRLLAELDERDLKVGRLEDHVGRHPGPAASGPAGVTSSPSGATSSPRPALEDEARRAGRGPGRSPPEGGHTDTGTTPPRAGKRPHPRRAARQLALRLTEC